MTRTLLSRIGHAVISILFLYAAVFGLMRLTGDPVYGLLGPDATAEDRELLRRQLGLDRPIIVQFGNYLTDLVQGDLGDSYRMRTPVVDHIRARLPYTLQMGGVALLLTVAVGLPFGVYAAVRPGRRFDRFARFVAGLGQSMPSFWVGFLLILIFAVNLRLVPAGFYGGPKNFILPTVTLAFGAIAGVTRFLRSSMIEELESDYVMFHRIKGVPERTIVWKHGLRNAGLTTLSYGGLLTASFLTGSVVLESVFVWPGVGLLMIEAINLRDIPIVQGCILLFSAIYVGMNLLVDLLYVVLDPRLR